MAKRLTDTGKWNDDWYISLSNDYRIIWQWLLDNCNHAGICKRSMKLLNMMCNTKIEEKDMILAMCERVLIIDNNWFIPKFLKFQYTTLHSNKPVIISVVNELEKYGILEMIPQSFGNDYIIVKDKRKDKDIDKDKDYKSIQSKFKIGENSEKNSLDARTQSENLFLRRISEGEQKVNRNRQENNQK